MQALRKAVQEQPACARAVQSMGGISGGSNELVASAVLLRCASTFYRPLAWEGFLVWV